jgi:hypothetical protein
MKNKEPKRIHPDLPDIEKDTKKRREDEKPLQHQPTDDPHSSNKDRPTAKPKNNIG